MTIRVIEAPDTPARPVPELHPETYPSGNNLRYPRILASPNAEPVPIIKLGIKVRRKAKVWFSLSPSTKKRIVKRLMYPIKKYMASPVIRFIYDILIQNFELIILAVDENIIRAL